jgi:hypothetical protein
MVGVERRAEPLESPTQVRLDRGDGPPEPGGDLGRGEVVEEA